MKLETDPRVVAKLAQEREAENWEFRTFLKGVDLEIEEMDAIVHGHYRDVARQIDCGACANCCNVVTPVLQKQDVERLAAGLNTSDREVTERLLTADEDGDLVFRSHPCPLLENNRCTVYEHRPEDCRSYPHLHKEEFVFRLIQAVANCSVCPIVFNVFERLKEELWDKADDASPRINEW